MIQPQSIRSDHEVQRDVADALVGDVRVDEANLKVEVKDGTVYLRGGVPSLFQKSTAEEIAWRIKGVKDVVDELLVVPVEAPSDAILKDAIEGALRRDAFVDERGIILEVHSGAVTLKGTVPSYTERAAAEDTARLVVGVKDVVNDLVVATPPIA